MKTFNLNTTEFDNIAIEIDSLEVLQNVYWSPNSKVLNNIEEYCRLNNFTNILEIGPGEIPFSLASHFIGKYEKIENYIDLDIDVEKIPYGDKHFDFIYCRHVLEDIQNPDFALKEMYRCSKEGYFETPSPIAELMINIDADKMNYKGYIQHRYISWYDYKTNNVYFLPKYPIIEHINFNRDYNSRLIKLMNEYCVYWNSYVIWKEHHRPNIVMLKNGINFSIREDYCNLLQKAINETIESTNYFIKNFK
jgi:hypothetical protein